MLPKGSERGALCVNGMSHYARNGENSNSAVCVSVFKSDYGATPRDAIEFQRKLERSAFALGGGDYSAPVSSVGAFLGTSNECGRVKPSYMGGKVKEADLRPLLPKELCDTLSAGLVDFGRKIKDIVDIFSLRCGGCAWCMVAAFLLCFLGEYLVISPHKIS